MTYISREAALESAWHNYYPSIDHYCASVKCATRKDLEAIPAADVRPVVRGEWVEDDYGFIHCSFCGMEWEDPEHPKTNFCPLCGADMREIEP